MNRKLKSTIFAMIAMLSLATIGIATTTIAQAQETVWLNEPNEHTDRLIAEAMSLLRNATADRENLSSVAVNDDGRISIFIDNGTLDSEDDMYIEARHNYTPANGYEFRGLNVIAPNGTTVFSGE